MSQDNVAQATPAPSTHTPPRASAPEPASVIDRMFAEESAGAAKGQNVNAMFNVALAVQVVLGQTRMPISQLLSLSRGSVIELEKRIGEPVEVMINDRLVARGDLVKVGDSRVGVTLTEIVKDFMAEG